jgi:hypothetical protein
MEELKYFFSYVREDTEFVLKLAQELRDAGANLWLDQLDILGGEHWDRAVEKALKSCQGMIVVLSPESVASNNVMDEVSFALEEEKQVVPVLARCCDKPFRLRRLQHIDFTTDYDKGISQLLRALTIEQPSQAPGLWEPEGHFARSVTEPTEERPVETSASERPAIRTEPTEPESRAVEGLEPPLPETPTVPKGKLRKAKKTQFSPGQLPPSTELPEPIEESPVEAPVTELRAFTPPLSEAPAEPERKPPEVQKPGLTPEFWAERLKSTLVGAAAGVFFGWSAFLLLTKSSNWKNLPIGAIIMGIGWGTIGAISGMQRKVMAVALVGMVVGFFGLWKASDEVLAGIWVGTALGGILGALYARSIIKKIDIEGRRAGSGQ